MSLQMPTKYTPDQLVERLSDLHLGLTILSPQDLQGRHPGTHKDNLGAGIVVQPSTTEAVCALVSWCAANTVGIVPQGGLTGFAGGSISRAGEVILSSSRLNNIISIEPHELTATVEAGVTLEALQKALAPLGLTTGIDFGARGSATIGGMVSTNAGGVLAFRNGVMRHQVLGLEAVLPSGEVFSDLTRVVKVSAGPDLKHLFIGGEGAFGFVTKAVLKLEIARPHRATAMLGMSGASSALALIRYLRGIAGVTLEAAEMMWPRYIRDHARLKQVDLDWLEADAAALLIEVSAESIDIATEVLETNLAEVWERFDIRGGVVARSLDQARRFWDLREDSSFYSPGLPGAASFDISVPPIYLDDYVAGLNGRLKTLDPSLEAYIYGHIADGNLHLTVIKRGPLPPEEFLSFETIAYNGIHEAGGSISAEHGVGTKKRSGYENFVSSQKRSLSKALKAVIDPKGTFNSGKVPF